MDIRIPPDTIRKAIDLISQKIPLTLQIQDIKQFQDRGRPYLFFICKSISFQLRIYNVNWAEFGRNSALKIQFINILKFSQQSLQLKSSSDYNSMANALQAVQTNKQSIKNKEFQYDASANNQMVSSKRFLNYSSFRQNLFQQFFSNSITLRLSRVVKRQEDQRYYLIGKLQPKYRSYLIYICKQNENYSLQISLKEKSVEQSDQFMWSAQTLTYQYVTQSITAFKGCCQLLSLADFYLNQFIKTKQVYLEEVGQIQSSWIHKDNCNVKISIFTFPHICMFQIILPVGDTQVRQTQRINHVSNTDFCQRVQKLIEEILQTSRIRRTNSVISAAQFQRYSRNIAYFDQ